MLTAITHMLLRRTVRRWFESEPDMHVMRRKLDRFVGSTDSMARGWHTVPDGAAGGGQLHLIVREGLPATAPLILYFHGGGYMVGGLASHGAFCSRLGQAAGARVLFADYRLAPEHHFPAALEDGLAALRHAAATASGKLYIAGDSAGGGLALAVTQAALAPGSGLRVPDGLILMSPWTDLTLSGASMAENAATDSMLSAKILTRMRAAYLGPQEPADRRASPLFDPNTHLPPVLLIYSTSEVLRDDSVRLAENLRRGGTAVSESAYAGKPHVFPLFRTMPGAGKAVREMAAFIG